MVEPAGIAEEVAARWSDAAFVIARIAPAGETERAVAAEWVTAPRRSLKPKNKVAHTTFIVISFLQQSPLSGTTPTGDGSTFQRYRTMA